MAGPKAVAKQGVAYRVDDALQLLCRVAAALQQRDWFSEEWVADAHHFPAPPENPVSATMHVFQKHWYNDGGQGIHFEVQLSEKDWKRETALLTLHIFHSPVIPGTSIKRIAVTKPFIDAVEQRVRSWEGYQFRAGKYGTQAFSVSVSIADGATQILEREIEKLCLQLSDNLDACLAGALGKGK